MTSSQATPRDSVLAKSEGILALSDCAFDGMALWEPDPWRVEYANPAFWQLIVVPEKVLGAKPASNEVPAWLRVRLAGLLERLRDLGVEAAPVTASLDCGADRKPIEVRVCHVSHDGRRLVGMIVREFADEQPALRDANDSVRRDPLTELPDREFLMTRLANLLQGERVADRHSAVIFLDLDNFKQVNDEFGHLIGDNVLREAARRIAGCLREGDHVVRYGGDEFVALIQGATTAHEVEPIIGRIHLALSTPIAVPGGEVFLSLSAGMALASEAGGSPEELLAAADRAMYAAKRTVA